MTVVFIDLCYFTDKTLVGGVFVTIIDMLALSALADDEKEGTVNCSKCQSAMRKQSAIEVATFLLTFIFHSLLLW